MTVLAAAVLVAVVTAVLAAGALLVALARRPQRGVLLLAALAPFDGLLLIVPHPPLVEGWKEALVLAVLAATVVAPAAARGAPERRLPTWLLPLTGFAALSAVSAVAVGGVQGVQGLKIGFFYLLLLAALWRCPLDAAERDRLVSVLMGTGAVVALVGLGQQVVGAEALVALGYEYDTAVRTTGGLLRSFSTFVQPFPFGLFVMLVLLVALPVALADPRRTRNTAFLAATPVLVAGLLSSTVRSAMLGLAVGLLVLAVLRHRGLAHLLVPAALVLVLVPPSTYAALLSSSSLGDRTSGWQDMTDVVLSSPFGVGIGATGSAAEATTAAGGDTGGTLFAPEWSAGYQPDNHYVKVLLELGPLGLWMFVLLLAAVFAAARTVASRVEHRADAALAAGTAASVAAAAAASFVATYFEIFPLDLYFWLLAGVLADLGARLPAPRRASAP